MRPLLVLLTGIAASAAEIPVTDEAIHFSPYNSPRQGSEVVWVYPGSYLHTRFSGARAALRVRLEGVGGAVKFRWSIDAGPLQSATLRAGQELLPLAADLPDGEHALTLLLAATDANDDRWQIPRQAVRLRGLVIDDAARLSPPAHRPARRAVIFGDSITEGAWNLGDSYRVADGRWADWVAHSDATQAWPRFLAEALQLDYGVIASGGMSWLRPSHSGIPPFPESWRFHWAGHPRTLNPAPDLVIVNMGTNDGARDTSAAVTQWLQDIRRATGPRTPVFLLIPFGQQNREPLSRAVQAANDPFVHLIDCGPEAAAGLNKYREASAASFDGLHPNAATHAALARLLAEKIKPLL
jgi:lysophospholipase L1-like esterase